MTEARVCPFEEMLNLFPHRRLITRFGCELVGHVSFLTLPLDMSIYFTLAQLSYAFQLISMKLQAEDGE